jgi:two-component system chemotaxis sensor kinase CheA
MKTSTQIPKTTSGSIPVRETMSIPGRSTTSIPRTALAIAAPSSAAAPKAPLAGAKGSIERNVKAIAVLGGSLFVILVGVLFFVQYRLGASQRTLADTIVPTQRELGELSGNVGAMFLRETAIVAASGEQLAKLRDRGATESALRSCNTTLHQLLAADEIRAADNFPHAVADSLSAEVDGFLAADAELYTAVSQFRELETKLAARVAEVDASVRQVTEASSGAAGVLRLEYAVLIRDTARDLGGGAIDARRVRQLVLGDSRAQLGAIDQLDRAMLRLGVLAGKVGHAANRDDLNSLSANELVQNRNQIGFAMTEIKRLVAGTAVDDRVRSLDQAAQALTGRVGDEHSPDSLLSLRRATLAAGDRVTAIRTSAGAAATRLAAASSTLRGFAQDLARSARDQAGATIVMTRVATLIVVLICIGMCVVAAMRLRTSVSALRDQNRELASLSQDLARANTGLEDTVAARTASLQLVLDSTGDGLLSVGLDGVLGAERSRAVADWLGPARAGITLWDYLAADDERLAFDIRFGFEQMAEAVLPFELCAAQAPARFHRDNRTFALSYRDVQEKGALARILVVVRDITAQIEAEHAERAARELHRLIGQLLRDRTGFHQMVEDCTALIAEVTSAEDPAVIRRGLHTIKGNCAMVGFERVAAHVHELETTLTSEERNPTVEEHEALAGAWIESLRDIQDYLQRDGKDLEIEDQDVSDLTAMVRARVGHEALLETLESWQAPPTAAALHRLAAQTRHVAQRIGKAVEVIVEHNRLRTSGFELRTFWSALVHAVRNAVDHGIEEASLRAAAGKPATAKITLSTEHIGDALVVEIRDDGGGIDWDAVRTTAAQRGLAHDTRGDLVEALFHDGLSTRSEVTQLSGRGVGLGAVRSACRAAGGQIELLSEPGRGTCVRCTFPNSARHRRPRRASAIA